MMHDSIRVTRRPRRAWPTAARTAGAVIVAAALALLVAACSSGSPSSGGSSTSGGSSSSPSAVAFAHCMRTHGVPNYPDPDSHGNLGKTSAQQLGVSSSAFNAAKSACQSLLPNTIGGSFDQQVRQCYTAGVCPQALVQQMMTRGRTFAQCMRSHAVPKWPDPTLDSQGRPFFNLSGAGFTHSQWHSDPIRSKAQECDRLVGDGLATG
jgi:hypothetical protein